MSDPNWVKLANALLIDGKQYLQHAGWGEFDVDFLAEGKKLPGPKKFNAILGSVSVDGRPPAEIVSAARMIQSAEALVDGWSRDLGEDAPLGMFILGQEEALASIFRMDSGHPAQAVTEPTKYREIAERHQELRRKAANKNFKLQENRRMKLGSKSEQVAERNRLIRLWGKCFAMMPGHFSRIAGKVTHLYNKQAFKNYPPYRRLRTQKTVLEILRPDIVPPAKPKK